MIKNLTIVLILLTMSGCASSTFYVYDTDKEKFVPESKMTNRGMGVTADHENKTISNKIIELPDVDLGR